MVRPEGLGPSALRLKVECSTAELWAHMVARLNQLKNTDALIATSVIIRRKLVV